MKEDRSSDRPANQRAYGEGFHVECKAGEAGLLRVGTGSVSFTVSQLVSLQNRAQLWESVRVRCQKEDDGSLTVQVLIWDPKLEGALQIAHLRSRPADNSTHEPLECDFEKKMLP